MPCFCTPTALPWRRTVSSKCEYPLLRHSARPRLSRRSLRCTTTDEASALAADLRAYLSASGAEPVDFATTLSYAALAENGRRDLVERMIDIGGYPAALALVGVETPPLPDDIPPVPVRVFNPPEVTGGIALGAKLDDLLNAPIPPPSTTRSRKRAPCPRAVERVPSAEELARGVQEAAARPSPVVDKPVPPGERLVLSGTMRAGLLALVAVSAVGFGRASVGVVDPAAVEACKGVAAVLYAVHSALAVYAAFEARFRMRRSGPLWFFKVLLSGPAGFVALRRLDVLDETAP